MDGTTTGAGKSYAFTQFEAISAREAFPCLDEPRWKTPFDVTLRVQKGDEAIANTRVLDRAPSGDLERVRFATTAPLPTYLVALAAGPFDIVEAPAIPPNDQRSSPLALRGVAVHGRGKEMAYALAHTGELLTGLERYLGSPYPFDKLDLIAVPEKGGAMENPGAVTFGESLLLFDERAASVDQRRSFVYVTAHELAHMWFGDLVTMPWWNDIWLNEAFATWMGSRVAAAACRECEADITLLSRVQGAMSSDVLQSARQIRQPVENSNDILNSFDSITYQKGAGVLSMVERWLGRDVFQKGLQRYLRAHASASATAEDLLAALGEASGRDVAAVFKSFLEQPGVPYIEAKTICSGADARVELRQSRFVPAGSSMDRARTWRIPLCVRAQRGKSSTETCTLLTEKEGSIGLPGGCPDWVFPNADAAGYFRFSLPEQDLARLLRTGYGELTLRERMALAASLRSGLSNASIPPAAVFAALDGLAQDEHPNVAREPMGLLGQALDWLDGDPLRSAVEARGRRLFAKPFAKLGYAPRSDEPPARAVLRQAMATFLALRVRDEGVLRELARRGRAYLGFGVDTAVHPDAVDPNLAYAAMVAAGRGADAKLFEQLLGLLGGTDDVLVRSRILVALGSPLDPQLAERARALALDPRLRLSEVMATLDAQFAMPETREAAWAWVKDHYSPLSVRLGRERSAGLAFRVGAFCDAAHAADAEAFFTPHLPELDGGPRNLASAVEEVRLCADRKAANLAGTMAYFKKQPR